MSISKSVLEKYVCDNFMETGTCNGDTVQLALECGYKNIYSVEIDPNMFKKCKNRFKDNGNVHLFLGDSIQTMPEMLKEINGKTTFWLDAHILDVSTVRGQLACPIIPEIEMILALKEGHNILIDDRRLFAGNGIGYWEFVKEKDIINKLMGDNRYSISYEDGVAPEDIIVAIGK